MSAQFAFQIARPPAGRLARRTLGALVLALGVVTVLLALLLVVAGPTAAPADEASHETHAVAPLTMDGDTLRIVVPAGTAAQVGDGGPGFALPPTIELRAGQTIEIRNDDRLTHVVLGEAVPAGTVVRRLVDTPGIEVYADGCAFHSVGVGDGMTTLIVSAPEPAA